MPKRTALQEARYQGQKNARLQSRYGITLLDYDKIKAHQGGKCALCGVATGKAKALSVDHDHALEDAGLPMRETVRGLLCGPCNRNLGWLEWVGVQKALKYIKRPPAHKVLGG